MASRQVHLMRHQVGNAHMQEGVQGQEAGAGQDSPKELVLLKTGDPGNKVHGKEEDRKQVASLGLEVHGPGAVYHVFGLSAGKPRIG